jgi:hypothetical protein
MAYRAIAEYGYRDRIGAVHDPDYSTIDYEPFDFVVPGSFFILPELIGSPGTFF